MKPNWDTANIIEAASGWLTSEPASQWSAQCDLLLWSIAKDDRPLLIEQCVVLIQYAESDHDRFAMMWLFRHPRETQPNLMGWHGSLTTANYQRHYRVFESLPNSKSAETFVRNCGYGDCILRTDWHIILNGADEQRWAELSGSRMSKKLATAIRLRCHA